MVENTKGITADDARSALSEFLTNNPMSEVTEITSGKGTKLRISKPWGDSSLALNIDGSFPKLAEALNKLTLPPRLSAIWHRESRRLEIIWTAYELPSSQKEIEGRKFEFRYENATHVCEFRDSSEELEVIAEHAEPIALSGTNHRNLYSFAMHVRDKSAGSNDIKSKPRSLWIDNVDCDDKLIELISNLNFYITYYDMLCPYVLIHPPEVEKIEINKARYRHDKFPDIVSGASLDENLLSFWLSAQSSNTFMAFLLYFRIIEYASFHYIEDAARGNIARILKAPNLLGNVPNAVDGIVSALASTQKLHDSQRIRLIIKKCVSPTVLWPDVRDNQEFFSKPTCFDGGFSVEGIIGAKDREENWGGHRLDSVADAFRKIRNALSHGKDMETTGVIRPTDHNINLFLPWVHLISAAAGEVVLYKDTH